MPDVNSRILHEELSSLRSGLKALSARHPDKGLVAAHDGMPRAILCRGQRRHLRLGPGLLGSDRQPLSQAGG